MGDVHRRCAGPQTRSGESRDFVEEVKVDIQGYKAIRKKQHFQIEVCFLFQCVNNVARKMGMNRSLDLPDKTLQFIRDRPLMDEAVRPLTGGPLLVKRGALLTRIVVDSVLALDGERYAVMFIGTGKL